MHSVTRDYPLQDADALCVVRVRRDRLADESPCDATDSPCDATDSPFDATRHVSVWGRVARRREHVSSEVRCNLAYKASWSYLKASVKLKVEWHVTKR